MIARLAGAACVFLAGNVGAERRTGEHHTKAEQCGHRGLEDPVVIQRLHALGQRTFPPNDLTPEALGNIQKGAIEKWWPIVKAENIKQE